MSVYRKPSAVVLMGLLLFASFPAAAQLNTVPSFAESVPAQSYRINSPVFLVLPTATGGDGTLSYSFSATPSLPAGLTYLSPVAGANHAGVIFGYPTGPNPVAAMTYTLTAQDSDGNVAASDAATLNFTIEILTALASGPGRPSFGTATVPPQSYVRGTMAMLPFPAATGGNGALSYSLSPTLPAGLNYTPPGNDGFGGVITGTPGNTAALGVTTYTLMVQDEDRDTSAADADTLVFTISILASGAIPNLQAYAYNQTVYLSWPPTTSNNNGFQIQQCQGYTLDTTGVADTLGEILRSGQFAGAQAQVQTSCSSWTQILGSAKSQWDRYWVLGLTNRTEYRFRLRVGTGTPSAWVSAIPNAVPYFDAFTVATAPSTYNINVAFSQTLPAAAGGDGALSYSLGGPALLTGLTYTPPAAGVNHGGVIAGTLNNAAEATYTLIAHDGDADRSTADAGMLPVTIAAVAAPTFGAAVIEPQRYVMGNAVNVTLPAASGGDGTLQYSVVPSLPSNLALDASTRVLSGTPATAQAVTVYTLIAHDGDSDRMVADAGTLLFTIAIEADTTPTFGSASVPAQTYMVANTAVALSLPAATGGNSPLSYSLSPLPPGLSFDPQRRFLSGTPTTMAGQVAHTLTVRDADGDAVNLSFNITVSAQSNGICARTAAVRAAILGKIPGVTACGNVTATHLAAITGTLNLGHERRGCTGCISTNITSLLSGDFAGLTNLEHLSLDFQFLTALPAGIFAGLNSLRSVDLGSNDLASLRADVFAGLSALETIWLFENELTTLPANVFAGLRSLRELRLSYNKLTTLPAGIFAGLSLDVLHLHGNNADGYASTNPAGPQYINFSLNLQSELVNDRVRLRLAQAAPRAIYVPWTATIGDSTETGVAVIPAGAPLSLPFSRVTSGQTIKIAFSNPAFRFNPGFAPIAPYPSEALRDEDLSYYIAIQPALAAASLVIGPDFGDATTADQNYIRNAAITNLILPAATGGATPINYTLTPSLPSGLGFVASTRVLSGTPTASQASTEYTLTATDANNFFATLNFNLSVASGAGGAPNFGANTIAAQRYTQGTSTSIVLPAVDSGGDAPLVYSIRSTPALPAGLGFTASTRTLAGNPTTGLNETTYTYVVTDTDGDTDTIPFTIYVDGRPEFTDTVARQDYDQGTSVNVQLPGTTKGNPPLSHALTPLLTPGLTYTAPGDGDTHGGTLTGTPTTAEPNTDYTLRVTDADGDMRDLTFTVYIDGPPSFGSATIPDYLYGINEAVNITLPAASGGNGALTYTLNPTSLPAELTFNNAMRTITGRATTTAASQSYTWAVADSDTNNMTSDSASLSFSIEVTTPDPPLAPMGVTATAGDQQVTLSWTLGDPSTTGYEVQRCIPAGFCTGAWTSIAGSGPATVTGTVMNLTNRINYGFRLRGVNVGGDGTPSTEVTAVPNSVPQFPSGMFRYTLGRNVLARAVLPAASGGDGQLSYALATMPALPNGLTYNESDGLTGGTISGRPTATSLETAYTLTAQDNDADQSDADTAMLIFIIEVDNSTPPPPNFTAVPYNQLVWLNWDNPSPGRISSVRYQLNVCRMVGGMETCGGWSDLLSTHANSTSLTITHIDPQYDGLGRAGTTGNRLQNGTEYISRLRFGSSGRVSEARATPRATLSFTATLSPQVYNLNEAIAPRLLLPPAHGGTFLPRPPRISMPTERVVVTYALTPNLPAGLTYTEPPYPEPACDVVNGRCTNLNFNRPTGYGGAHSGGAISGTPTSILSETTYTLTATDAASTPNTSTLLFTIEVADPNALTPEFTSQMVANRRYPVNQQIEVLALPSAINEGNTPVTYSLQPALPAGLSFDSVTRFLTGAPTSTAADATYTLRVTDADGETADLTFNIEVFQPPAVTVNPTRLTIAEGGSSSYTLVLTTRPTGNVTITPNKTGSDDVSFSPNALTFTQSDWNTEQTVSISDTNDGVIRDDIATISHRASGGGYNSVTIDSVAVTVTDDDVGQPGVIVDPTQLTILEGSTAGRYTLRLATQPTGNVTITPNKTGSDDVSFSPSTLTFTQSDWNTAQTVSVSDAQDNVIRNDSATISHSASGGGYNSVTISNVVITVTDDESPGVMVDTDPMTTGAQTALSVTEGASGNYTIVLTGEPSGNVMIRFGYNQSRGISLNPATSLSFSTTNWNVPQTVTVTAADNATFGSNPEVTIAHTAQGGSYAGTTIAGVTVSVQDNDAGQVTISPTDLTLVEEGSATTYTVVLDQSPGNLPATVQPASANTTLSFSPTTLTFNMTNWSMEQTITVTAGADADMANEVTSITHTVSAVTSSPFGNVAAPSISVSIEDDDDTSTPRFSISGTPTTAEGGSLTFSVVGSVATPTAAVTATCTVSGTGVTAGDFRASSAATTAATTFPAPTLTFQPATYDTAQNCVVYTFDDATPEAAENFTVTLNVSGGGARAGTSMATGAINASDAPNIAGTTILALPSTPITFVDLANTGGAVDDCDSMPALPGGLTVDVTSIGNTCRISGTLTSTATRQDHQVTATNAGGSSTATVTVATPGVTVDPTRLTIAEGNSSSYTLVLTVQPTGTVTITPNKTGSDDVSFNPSALTFTRSNWSTAQTVSVTDTDDSSAGTDTATISHSAGGGGYDSVTISNVAVTVTDDEALGVTVDTDGMTTGAQTNLSVTEGASGSYTVVLTNRPSGEGNVVVRLRYDQASTVLSVSPSASVSFTTETWDTAQTVQVTARDNDTVGSNPSQTIAHTVTGGGYTGTTVPSVVVSIADNDAGQVTISPTMLTVDEQGSGATYTVVLDRAPQIAARIAPASDNATLSFNPTSIRFNNTNFNTAQTVTVTAGNDANNTNETTSITHMVRGIPSSRSAFAGVTAPSISVTIRDDDTPTANFSISGTPTAAEGGSLTFSVVGSITQPSANVMATCTVSGTGVTAGDFRASSVATTAATTFPAPTLTFQPATYDTAQNCVVYTFDDATPEAAENFTVTLSVSGGDARVGTAMATGTINASDPPDLDGDTLIFTEGVAITAVTLTNNGGAATNCGSAPALPSGLTLDVSGDTCRIRGTPDNETARRAYQVTATNAGGSDMENVVITVGPPLNFMTSVNRQFYTQNSPITTLTLPAAVNGTGTLSYGLTPTLPNGLTYYAPGETITTGVMATGGGAIAGTPTVVSTGIYTLAVTDANSSTASLRFGITVNRDRMPLFIIAPGDQNYRVGTPVSTNLPAATDGDGTLSYSLTTLPSGLNFDDDVLTITGTPSAAAASAQYTLTATDTDGDQGQVSFSITVVADSMPSFGSETVSAQNYRDSKRIDTLELPQATGGDGDLTYSITPALPSGLQYLQPRADDSHGGTLSGVPTTMQAIMTYSLNVRDADGDEADLEITIAIAADSMPSFSMAVPNQIYRLDVPITPLTLPPVMGGDPVLTYTMTHPRGLVYTPPASASDRMTHSGTLSGTPNTIRETATTYTLTVEDDDGDTATRVFTISVPANNMPSFGADTVADQTYVLNQAITTLTLPTATGGDGTLSHVLRPSVPPSGLALSSATQTITGTPDSAGTSAYRWVALDADGSEAVLSFSITVSADSRPAFAGSFAGGSYLQNDDIGTLSLPAVTGGDTPLTYVITTLPNGLSYTAPVDRTNGGTLEGTPDTPQAAMQYTLTVTDADGDAARLGFSIEVPTDSEPTFAMASLGNLTYRQNEAIDPPRTFPAVTGGDGTLTFALQGTGAMTMLPNGLAYTPPAADDTHSGTLSGTSTVSLPGGANYQLTVTDADNDVATLSFRLIVTADTVPEFSQTGTPPEDPVIMLGPFRQNDGVQTAANPMDGRNISAPDPNLGDGTLVHTINPSLPAGITYAPSANGRSTSRFSGAPTVAAPLTTYTVTLTDEDGDNTGTPLLLIFEVTPEPVPDFGAGPGDQTYPSGTVITTLTLPQASGGDPTLAYTAAALPPGLAYNAPAGGDSHGGTITGTPTSAGRYPTVITVTDRPRQPRNEEDTDTLAFIITVTTTAGTGTAPSFGTSFTGTYTQNTDIGTINLPTSTSGDAPLAYSLAGTLPNGMTFNAGPPPTLTGEPTATQGATQYTLTVTDTDGDAANLLLSIAVAEDLMPSFGSGSISAQSYRASKNIGTVTFSQAQATGGDGALTYSVASLPPGLTYTAPGMDDTHGGTLMGEPTTMQAIMTYSLNVRDADGDEADLEFTIAIAADMMPSFGTSTVTDQSYRVGSAITPLILPALTTTGDAELTFTMTRPAGLTYTSPADSTVNSGILSGRPTTAAAAVIYTLTVTDDDGDEAMLDVAITVAADGLPSFADTVADQNYRLNTAITDLILPTATGGDGTPSYALQPSTLPAGLAFDADGSGSCGSARTICGTPTEVTSIGYTWRATDADNTEAEDDDVASETFSITVSPNRVPSFSRSFAGPSYRRGADIGTVNLPQATGGDGTLSYTLTALPSGLTYAAPGMSDAHGGTLTGTPDTAQSAMQYTLSVADEDSDTTALVFSIEVLDDLMPTFGSASIDPQDDYRVSKDIGTVPLPQATGGDGALTYSITAALPGA